jgi:hypothetical protein
MILKARTHKAMIERYIYVGSNSVLMTERQLHISNLQVGTPL